MKKIIIYEEKVKRELGDLFGLFFEDLNHAADGGMYAELVQNRSFEFCSMDNPEYNGFTAWEKSQNINWEIRENNGLNEENKHYLHVDGKEKEWISNNGFNNGIYMKCGENYILSFWGRTEAKEAKINIELSENADDHRKVCAETEFVIKGRKWEKYEAVIEANITICKGQLKIILQKEESLDLDMVSLFPKDTFCGRKNGMRKDIAEALCEMNPKFLRFPGGCLTHTGSLDGNARDSMYRWKKTLGPVEKRPARKNTWGYNQTLGIGYYEYFLFCEDIGAKPIPVLPGGFNPHTGEGVPISELGDWVQEVLDLIEFANGDLNTKWGSIRADLGHPQPFGMEYIAIGNEEIGEGFFERYSYFHKAIRKKYPKIKIINSAGPFSTGEGYNMGWKSAKKNGSDFIDEHYYSSPEWFLANMHHYEDYDASGTKVFLGEYASWGNTYYNALVEAAYMTHLERSAAVGLACYAPLLCNIDYVNWKPNMIWFDNCRILKTANYYVQQLFMKYQGTEELVFDTEGLNEILPLIEREWLDGEITITGNDTSGIISNIKIDEEGQKRKEVEGFFLEADQREYILTKTKSKHVIVEFNFSRREGRKGIKVTFGKKDKNNYLQWEFGGWDNWDSNIISVENGKSSVISHRIFHVENIPYTLKIDIDGYRIRTWINREMFNDTKYRLPELEELYISASSNRESGEKILKVVNLTGEEKKVQIYLQKDRYFDMPTSKRLGKINIVSLKGHGLTDENTFDNPDKIVPVEEIIEESDRKMEYVFEPHSFYVLIFEGNKREH